MMQNAVYRYAECGILRLMQIFEVKVLVKKH